MLNSGLTITDSTLSYNAANGGGGINNDGLLTMTGCTLSHNSATGENGGGIRNYGTVALSDSTLSRNSAQSNGGGIYNNDATVTVTHSILLDNSAAFLGGGIHNLGTVGVANSEFSGNSASWGGGIQQMNSGTLTVTSSVFSNNSASSGGGGINNDGTVTVSNGVFSGNFAGGDGGGIRNIHTLTVTDSTLSGNMANRGGGICSNSEVTLNNSILAKNAGAEGPDVRIWGTLSGSHNLLGNGSGQTALVDGTDGNLVGTALNPVDPMFVINPSNGGDGWGDDPDTPGIDESANDNYGDLRLWDESPAIDAGDNALLPADTFDLDGDGNVTEPLPFDLAGDTRVQDGDNDQTPTVNMGAYETTAGAMPDRLTLYVDADVSPAGDGLSWSTAFANPQDALSEAATRNTDMDPANDIDQIWIAEGIYMPSAKLEPGDARSAAFSLLDGVALYGGFAGMETTLEERDISAHITTLSGDLGTVDDISDNAYTVVYCGLGIGASLDGFSVVEGNADGSEVQGHRERIRGAGLYVTGGTVTVTNTTMSGHLATYGAAIYAFTGATLLLEDSTLSNNAAEGGAAITNVGTMTLTNSVVSENSAELDGGGIRNHAVLTVTNSLLTGNSTGTHGGAIRNYATLTVSGGSVSDNLAEDNGGGIFHSENGTMSVTDTTFADNSAGSHGAGIWSDAEATLVNVTLSENSARWDGGGICSRGTLSVTNGTISGNSASSHGAGIWSDAEATLVNVTLSENSARWDGGGICSRGTLSVTNGTISGNSASWGGGIWNNNTVTVTSGTLCGNSANGGGGIMNHGTLTMANSMVSGNSVGSYGGGIRNQDGTMTLMNSTVAGNTAAEHSGGISNNNSAALHNSIIAKNAAPSGPNIQDSGSLSGSHNLIGDGSGQSALIHGTDGNLVGTTASAIDPLFTRAPSDGGDGWGDDPNTPGVDESANDDYGDLGLQEGSPAIDAGSNALLPVDQFDLDGDGDTAEPIPVDVIGDIRIRDGDGDETEIVDMGAREYCRYPIVLDDAFEIASDEILSIPGSDLTANDLCLPGMTLHVVGVAPPTGMPGTLDFDGEIITFTPEADFIGTAWFDYTVESTSGKRSTGTVTVNVVPIPGDLNLDGQVSSRDLDIIRAWWQMEVEPGNLTKGDPSGDGLVGSADLDIVRANWQRTSHAVAAITLPPDSSESAGEEDALDTPTTGPVEEATAKASRSPEATWAQALDAMASGSRPKAKAPARTGLIDLVLQGWE